MTKEIAKFKFFEAQPPQNIYFPQIVPYPSNTFVGGVFSRIDPITNEPIDDMAETGSFFFRLTNEGKFVQSYPTGDAPDTPIRLVNAYVVNGNGKEDDQCSATCRVTDNHIDILMFDNLGNINNYFDGCTLVIELETNIEV